MKIRLRGESYFLLATMVAMILVVILALSLPLISRLLPLVFAGIIFILAAIRFFRRYVVSKGEQVIGSKDEEERESAKSTFLAPGIWLVTYILGIYFLGLILASFSFSLLYMRMNGTKWIQAAIITLVLLIFIYIVFGIALDVDIYPGVILKIFMD